MGFKIKKLRKALAPKAALKNVKGVAKNKLVQLAARGAAAYATGGASEAYIRSAQMVQSRLKKTKSQVAGVDLRGEDAAGRDAVLAAVVNTSSDQAAKTLSSRANEDQSSVGSFFSSFIPSSSPGATVSASPGMSKKLIIGALASFGLLFILLRKR